ncbi:MAG: type II toxin-antitoxin system VapC family toxin [Verrucomicrobiota bacterium]
MRASDKIRLAGGVALILLDTHAFIWWCSDRGPLSAVALSRIEENVGRLFISVGSALEIALLIRKERLKLPIPPDQFIQRALNHHGIHELPLKRQTVLAAINLPDIHNDPIDRILVAEAHTGSKTIVTKDTMIPNYPGIKTAW